MIVAASILSADFSKLGEEIKAVEKAGADWIHIDVMDGYFVRNLTIGPPVIKKIRPISELFYDVHLMVLEPERLLDSFIESGPDSITIHYEATNKLGETLAKIKSAGLKTGISIKPDTNISFLTPFLKEIDLILIMTVEPGWGGQNLIKSTLEKVRLLRKMKQTDPNNYHFLIQVDGGINKNTIDEVKDAGVDVVVAGSYIFKHESYEKAIEILHNP